MIDHVFSIFADPQLIKIALCLVAILVLRWIEMSERSAA